MKVSIELNGHSIKSIDLLPEKILDSIQDQHGQRLESLSLAAKAQIVRDLDSMGFLAVRNAVNIISRRLSVSRVCVYSWINGSRRGRRLN